MDAQTILGFYSALPTWLIVVLAIWALVWKGLALWKSSHKEQQIWFVVLLVVNTFGLLEILYLFVFSKMKPKRIQAEKPKRKR